MSRRQEASTCEDSKSLTLRFPSIFEGRDQPIRFYCACRSCKKQTGGWVRTDMATAHGAATPHSSYQTEKLPADLHCGSSLQLRDRVAERDRDDASLGTGGYTRAQG